MDGWDLEQFDDLNQVCDEICNMKYEIDKCIRGCNTGCHTYAELAGYIHDLGERLQDCAYYLEGMHDPAAEDDGEDA